MWIELFLCLVLAHLVADFALQTNKICKNKAEKKWRSSYHYGHAVVVFVLSWFIVYDLRFWWCAAVIGVSHFAIDMWKSYRPEKVLWFASDQIFHLLVLIGISLMWNNNNVWSIPFGVYSEYIAMAVAFLACWKPANILIKLILKHYSVNMPEDNANGFNAGALIGIIERWLILIFVWMQRYEALGLLIAAKSIIRYSEKETTRTEYVLAGTLLSIFIAVVLGIAVIILN